MPDLEILCKIFLDPKAPPNVKIHVLRMIFGGQTDRFDFHYFGWDYNLLKSILEKVGFNKIEKVKTFSLFKDTSDLAPYGFPISLNLIAYK